MFFRGLSVRMRSGLTLVVWKRGRGLLHLKTLARIVEVAELARETKGIRMRSGPEVAPLCAALILTGARIATIMDMDWGWDEQKRPWIRGNGRADGGVRSVWAAVE